MNFGFRYHLASLMAVFLSLFLGILIGGALFQDSALVEEQGLLIEEMEQRFVDLQGKLGVLQENLAQSQKSWELFRTKALTGQLLEQTVLVVGTSEKNKQLTELLHFAGAEVETLALEELSAIKTDCQLAVVVPLEELEFEHAAREELARLTKAGVQIVYVSSSPLSDLRQDLQSSAILNIDSLLGELALVLGLASGSELLLGLGS